MTLKHKYVLVSILIVLAVTLGACGSSASNDSVIATSVALTVQAQNTQQAQLTPTFTDLPPLSTPPTADSTQGAPPTAPPTAPGAAKGVCISANFVGETIPDGTIELPGANFLKVWHVLNSGTCTWDSTWKFVFVSGDVMGGAFVYNFPQPAAPGQTVDIPIQLIAPQVSGTYTGDWKIQSPWGGVFGVGQYDTPLTVSIVVGNVTPANKKTPTVFDITSVTYTVVRIPAVGCPASVNYQTTAYVTTNGPVDIGYEWIQYDGNDQKNLTLSFSGATTQAVVRDFKNHLGATNNPRWLEFIETWPTYHEFGKSTFTYNCH